MLRKKESTPKTTTSSESAMPEPGSEHLHCCEHHETLDHLIALSKIAQGIRHDVEDQAAFVKVAALSDELSAELALKGRMAVLDDLVRLSRTAELLSAAEELLTQALEAFAEDDMDADDVEEAA